MGIIHFGKTQDDAINIIETYLYYFLYILFYHTQLASDVSHNHTNSVLIVLKIYFM